MEDKIKEYMSDEELEQLILNVEAHSMLSAPSYLKDEIMEQLMSDKKAERKKYMRKRLSLWLYSAEVGIVAAAAILLLFLLPTESIDIEKYHDTSAISTINQKSNDLCGSLFEITNQLVNWEKN